MQPLVGRNPNFEHMLIRAEVMLKLNKSSYKHKLYFFVLNGALMIAKPSDSLK